jgi:hypothetical protein
MDEGRDGGAPCTRAPAIAGIERWPERLRVLPSAVAL